MNENEINGDKLTPQEAYEAYNRGEMNEADYEATTGQKAPTTAVGPLLDTAIALGGIPHEVKEEEEKEKKD